MLRRELEEARAGHAAELAAIQARVGAGAEQLRARHEAQHADRLAKHGGCAKHGGASQARWGKPSTEGQAKHGGASQARWGKPSTVGQAKHGG